MLKRFKKFIKSKDLKIISIIFLIFFIPRIIGLGFDNYGVDANLWDVRSDKFTEAVLTGNFMETNQKYHPGVTVMWLSGFSKKLFHTLFEFKNGYSPTLADGIVYPELFFINLFFAVFPLVTVISILLTLSSYLLYKMKLPFKFILIFSFILSVEPFFLGISRFFHLTGLESVCGFTSFILAYYAAYSKKRMYIFLSSFVFALGILTKTSTLIFLPFIGISLFLGYLISSNIYTPKNIKIAIIKSVTNYIFLLILTALFIFILWPALWVDFLWVIQDVYNSGIRDRAFVDNPSPSLTNNKYLYYYEMFFLRSSALVFISFIASIFLLFKAKKDNMFVLFVVNFLFIPYYAYILALPEKQIDRYVTVLFPSAVFCGSYFIYYLSSQYKKYSKYIYIFIIGYFLVLHWVYYPNYSSPINELFGGPYNYSKYTKVMNRGEFYLQLTQYLNRRDGKNAYHKNLIVPQGGKDLSAKGYLGTIYTDDGLIPEGKDLANYYAPNYLDLEEVPKDRECSKIKEFGYRWPLKFTYLYLYECD